MKQIIFVFAFVFFLIFNADAQNLGWGYNEYANLGIGNAVSAIPSPLAAPVSDAVGIGGGGFHTLFLRANGTVVASGLNNWGQAGDGTTEYFRFSPIPVLNLTNVVQVSGGGLHSAALLANGQVWSWGFNQYGQIGNGTTSVKGCNCIPTPKQSNISGVVQIDAGENHTLALKSDGTVWAWGWNDFGQLGDGTTEARPTPQQVPGLSGIIAVSAGGLHSIALKNDGRVYIWGFGSYGQIGNNTNQPGTQLSPALNTTLANVVQIAAGDYHSFALLKDGTVRVFGRNDQGQLGNGFPYDDVLAPTQTTGIENVIEIETIGSTNYVRMRDGTVKSWGENFYGSVGNGVTSNGGGACSCRSFPVTTLVGAGNAAISAGRKHAFALKPVIAANAGTNQTFSGDSLRLSFSSITSAGDIAYTAIDPSTAAANYIAPAGYVIEKNQPAYDVTTTTTSSGNIDVCISSVNEFDQTNFRLLKILHAEGSNLVDRTQYSIFQRRQICARVASLSPFVIARGQTVTPDSFSIGGSVTFSEFSHPSRATVTLTDASGNVKNALINPFGYYRFDGIGAGQRVTVRISSRGAMFTPQSVTVTDNVEDLNFVSQF